MAGHSKWANIRHRKGRQDAKRSKIFTRLIREIIVAAKMGDPTPENNPRLRNAIDEALSNNVPKDKIKQAITRATGGGEGGELLEVRYEGYGPGGVAVMVDCMTDNINRTVGEVRHAFTKHGGNLGTDGSVAFIFTKRGVITVAAGYDEDEVMNVSLEAGAEDMNTNDDGSIEIATDPDTFFAVKEALNEAGFELDQAEVTMVPSTQVELDESGAEKMLKLFDRLESLDDVQNVYSNADINDEIIEKLT